MKKLLLLSLLIACAFPAVSHAQLDQRCWIAEDCYNARAELYGGKTPERSNPPTKEWAKVFRQDDTTKKLCGTHEDAGGAQIGFCLPATTAKTKISIGGQTEFTGLAEFIAFIYKYGLSLASLLAVLMIIYAGVQWTISGGNTEAISSAQHKIYGAVIGLVILAAAYTILYTVNPDLVNLRPPNAWMINMQKISAPYCNELKTGLISKIPSNETGKILTTEQKKAGFSAIASNGWNTTSTAKCGSDYFVQKTGALTCTGTVCDEPAHVCYDKLKTQKFKCHPENIAGEIYSGGLLDQFLAANMGFGAIIFNAALKEGWSGPDWADDPEIYSVCNNGDYDDLSVNTNDPNNEISSDQKQRYYITTTNNEIGEHVKRCVDKGGFKGFVLSLDLNEAGDGFDERHFIGQAGSAVLSNSVAIDLGDKDKDKADCVLSIIKPDFFISEIELTNGVLLNVNMSNMYDIDNNDQNVKLGRMFHYGNLKNYFIEDGTYNKCL